MVPIRPNAARRSSVDPVRQFCRRGRDAPSLQVAIVRSPLRRDLGRRPALALREAFARSLPTEGSRARSAAFRLPAALIAALLSPCTLGDSVMASGIVKWFNGQKGYGFIQPDTGGKDVFVHISAVEKAGMDGLPEGAKITYDMISDRGKESAGNLQLK